MGSTSLLQARVLCAWSVLRRRANIFPYTSVLLFDPSFFVKHNIKHYKPKNDLPITTAALREVLRDSQMKIPFFSTETILGSASALRYWVMYMAAWTKGVSRKGDFGLVLRLHSLDTLGCNQVFVSTPRARWESLVLNTILFGPGTS